MTTNTARHGTAYRPTGDGRAAPGSAPISSRKRGGGTPDSGTATLARRPTGVSVRAFALLLALPGGLFLAMPSSASPVGITTGVEAFGERSAFAGTARTPRSGIDRAPSDDVRVPPRLGMRTPPRLVRLGARSTLGAQDGIRSADGRFALLYREDGNLVLYGRNGPVWDSGTGGTGAGRVTMQADGDLVIRDARGRTVWSTGSAGNPRARLELSDDGSLVVRRADGSTAWARRAHR